MKKIGVILSTFAVLLIAGAAFAAQVSWMPNFPMRMPGAGVMAMWMPVPGATGYDVMRQIGDGPWEKVSTSPMNNYTDPTAPTDKDVGYKIIALIVGDPVESKPAVLKGVKPLLPPKDLNSRLDNSSKSLSLRWGAVNNASFYNVYRAEAAGDPGTMLTSLQDTKYLDAAIENKKSYWYYITAVGTNGMESPRGEAYKVDVAFKIVKKVKTFKLVQRELVFVADSWGEDFADFKNPTDILYLDGEIHVACEDGIQVIGTDGKFIRRWPLLQEMIATGVTSRPSVLFDSPDGNIFVMPMSKNSILEFTPQGDTLIREIVLPMIPGNPVRPTPIAVTVGPDGSLWVTDSSLRNIAIIPPGVSDTPTHEEITRLGFPAGGKKYDPATDGLIFSGATLLRYMPSKNKIVVVEAPKARLLFIDPETKEVSFVLGGFGGSYSQFSQINDFRTFDDDSLIVVDPLMGHVKRIKIGDSEEDTTNGDYLESFVDDLSDPQSYALTMPEGTVSNAIYIPEIKRVVMLAALANQVMIYDLK